jgi:hypothetical protein
MDNNSTSGPASQALDWLIWGLGACRQDLWPIWEAPVNLQHDRRLTCVLENPKTKNRAEHTPPRTDRATALKASARKS